MTLIIEKHPEFEKLARYFQKIESMADTMGIKVDDLVKHHAVRGRLINSNFGNDQQRISAHRQDVIKNHLSIVK